MSLYLGIDPGFSSGAAALVEYASDESAPQVVAALAWERRGKKLRTASSDVRDAGPAEHVTELLTPWLTGRALTGATVEGMFQSRKGGLILLFENAGECVGVCRHAGIEPHRPIATVWRREIPRIRGRVEARLAESRAVRWVIERELLTPPQLRCLGSRVRIGAACEAVCMALYARQVSGLDIGVTR